MNVLLRVPYHTVCVCWMVLVAGPRLESDTESDRSLPSSVSLVLSFPRNRTDQREIKTTDLRVGKKEGWREWSKIGGKEIWRERAEMRVRSGNEHTHLPRTYTHAAILLTVARPCLVPFLSLPGCWGKSRTLEAIPLALIG